MNLFGYKQNSCSHNYHFSVAILDVEEGGGGGRGGVVVAVNITANIFGIVKLSIIITPQLIHRTLTQKYVFKRY